MTSLSNGANLLPTTDIISYGLSSASSSSRLCWQKSTLPIWAGKKKKGNASQGAGAFLERRKRCLFGLRSVIRPPFLCGGSLRIPSNARYPAKIPFLGLKGRRFSGTTLEIPQCCRKAARFGVERHSCQVEKPGGRAENESVRFVTSQEMMGWWPQLCLAAQTDLAHGVALAGGRRRSHLSRRCES
jgi:hypothetical protein